MSSMVSFLLFGKAPEIRKAEKVVEKPEPTEAHQRYMRLLSSGPIDTRTIAELSGVTSGAALHAMRKYEDLGIVRRAGTVDGRGDRPTIWELTR